MRSSWDAPFDDNVAFDPIREQIFQAFRRASGVVVMTASVNVEEVQKAQQRLKEHFEPIYEAASEMLEAADPTTRKLSGLCPRWWCNWWRSPVMKTVMV